MAKSERIQFRLLQMGCCHHLLCWVNPRLPSFCPACGASVYPAIKGYVVVRDDNATLNYSETPA